MKFEPDEITSVIREEIARYRKQLDVAHVGRVLEVGDGIVQIFGLAQAKASEMLEFESGTAGQALSPRDQGKRVPILLKRVEQADDPGKHH